MVRKRKTEVGSPKLKQKLLIINCTLLITLKANSQQLKYKKMKKFAYLFVICLMVFACGNRESLTIKGNVTGNEDGTILLILKTNRPAVAKVLSKIEVKKGKFTFHTDSIKPPVCLTLMMNDSTNVDVFISKYGKFEVNIDLNKNPEITVKGDDMQKEYNAYLGRLDKAYLTPIKGKMNWIREKLSLSGENAKLTEKEEETFEAYEHDIERAYSHRRLSLIKTVRANPDSPVAMAVFFLEYNNMNKRHKAEMKSIYRKKYSDTTLYWQIFP